MKRNFGVSMRKEYRLLLFSRAAFSVLVFFAGVRLASAQADFEKGYQSFQSYHGSDFDTINLANGNLVLNIPLITYQQRGGLPPVVVAIRSNSTTFQSDPQYSSGPPDTRQHEVPSGVLGSPWGQPHVVISPGGLTWKEERITLEKESLSRFVAIDDSGATHSLGENIANSAAPYIGNIRYSVDGSDLMLTPAAQPLIVDRSGNIGGLADRNGNAIKLNGPCAQPAGAGQFYNPSLAPWEGYAYGTASATYILDSIGRKIPNPSYVAPAATYSCLVDLDASYYPSPARNRTFDSQWPAPVANDSRCPTEPNGVPGTVVSETYMFPGETGSSVVSTVNTLPITFCYQQIKIKANLPNVQHGVTAVNETWPVLTAAILPNGTEWQLVYDSPAPGEAPLAVWWGQVTSVTTPTGAVTSYTYGDGSSSTTPQGTGTRLACGNPPGEIPVSGTPVWPFSNLISSRIITSRGLTVADPFGHTTNQQWNYNNAIGSGWEGTQNAGPVTITDPDGNDVVHVFTLPPVGTSSSYGQPVCGPYESEVRSYQGSSKPISAILLKQVDTSFVTSGVDHANPTNFSDYIAIGVLPHIVTTTLLPKSANPQVRQDTYTYDAFGRYQDYKGSVYGFSFGQKLAETESDWGNGVAAAPIRTALHTNYWQSNWKYYQANLIDLPCLDTVFTGSYVGSQTSCTPPTAPSSQASQTSYVYDEPAYAPAGVFGDLTTATRWLASGSNPASHTAYNAQGMPTKKIDPIGNATSITYAVNGLYPSQLQYPATNGVATSESYLYDANAGLMTSHTDQNGQKTTFQYDLMRRLTAVIYADGGYESYGYNDRLAPSYNPPSFVFYKTLLFNGFYQETGLADTLGRKVETQLNSDRYGTIYTDTTYDDLGRVATQTNPYRSLSDHNYGVTTFTYDALNRKTIETAPDGSKQQWCYQQQATNGQTNCNPQKAKTTVGALSTGSWVDSQDEIGNDWQHNSDGLGRLVSVMEPNGLTQVPSMQTSYIYDVLGNLKSVAQAGNGTDPIRAPRTFNYDALSRLTSATNPEVGTATIATTTYSYDLDGNLLQKASPAVNVPAKTATASSTTVLGYCYDALNRLVGKWSAAPPSGCNSTPTSVSSSLLATYTYGTTASTSYGVARLIDEKAYLNGVLTSEATPTTYDTMGRLLLEKQTPYAPSATQYSINKTYFLDGNVNTEQNSGTGITFTYTYDLADRLSSIGSSLQSSGSTSYPGTLYSVANYSPVGVAQATYGGAPNTTGLLNLFRYYDNRERVVDNEVYPLSDGFATGTVTIAGAVAGSDTGPIMVTVGSVTESASYATGGTALSIANTLAGDFNQNGASVVTASVGGNSPPNSTNPGCSNYVVPGSSKACAVITFKAIVLGIYGNVALSITPAGNASFTTTSSGAALTGGTGSPQGSSTAYVYSLSYDHAGNVRGSNDAFNGSWVFSYDTLNRLLNASSTNYEGSGYITTGGAAAAYQCWTYDSFGNRTFELDSPNPCPASLSQSTPPTHYLAYNNKNQVTGSDILAGGLVYDAAGNVIQDANNKYVYDVEGRLCAVQNTVMSTATLTQYVYDADGERVAKGTPSALPASGTACAVPNSASGFTLTATYLRGKSGSQDAEFDPPPAGSTIATWHQNVYGNDGLLATYTGQTGSAPVLYFNFNDWLGNKRLEVDYAGNQINHWGSDPFGNYLTAHIANSDATQQHFTGKERDFETGSGIAGTGNDYFGARNYASNIGRFMSPDPGSVSGFMHQGDPQAWNGYAYVRNNPMGSTDPTGTTYTVCNSGGKCVKNVPDKTFEDFEQSARGSEYFQGTTMWHFGADGHTHVIDGSFVQTDVDMPGDANANIAAMARIARDGNGAINFFLNNMAGELAGGAAFAGVEALVDGYQIWRAARAMSRVARVGREGEEAVRAAEDIGAKKGFEWLGRKRVADGMTETTVNEVKNVARQGWTRQLKDNSEFARSTVPPRVFQLWLRDGAVPSSKLLQAEREGLVVIKTIPK